MRGVKTNPVKGAFTPREALDRLVADTGLVVTENKSDGAFAIARGSASDRKGQRATPTASDRPAPSQAAVPSADEVERDPAARPEDDAVELSPFTITSDSETGWVATETLAGSRLRTNFKDVPNQIETFTKDFMQDLAVTDIDQALIYSANAENAVDFVPDNPNSIVSLPAIGGRIRGIGSGSITRNFFQVHNPTDNFNLERATIASGPNAILFGLGSPSGIIDATPARAIMRDHYGFEIQFDSEESRRGTFDANVVVLPEKLAFRIMGLSKRVYTDRQPNRDADDRIYGAITFKPFENTTIALQGEKANRDWNRASRVAPVDFVTPWLEANLIPGSGYATPRPAFDNSNPANFAGIADNVIFTRAGEAPVIIQGGSVETRSWRDSVTVRGPGSLPGVDPAFDAGDRYTLTDPSIFPFDVNLVGSSRKTILGAYTKTVFIEQKFTDDLFLELAYNREDAYDTRLYGGGWAGSTIYRLHVDANQFIPGTTRENPNYGQFYFQGGTRNNFRLFDSADWRATLSYELDLVEKFSRHGGWGRWLGHHRFSGLYTSSKTTEFNQDGFDRRILDEPVIPGVTLRPRTFRNWAIHSSRTPEVRHYFSGPYDPMVAAGPFKGNWTLTDANGNPYTLYGVETPLRAADGKRLGARNVTTATRNKIDAHIFAWQGFFLPDREGAERLVLTFGYRKDSANSAILDAASLQRDFSGLYPILWDATFDDYGPTQSGINRSYGVVARPLKWFSVFYNQSTTFDLNTGRFDPYGEEIPGASGDGKDYGIRLDFLSDRLTLRVNKYENTLGPTRASNLINGYRHIYFNIEQRALELDPGLPTINIDDGNMRGYQALGRFNYNFTSDFAGEGYEVDLNFTPAPNWNIRLNGAKSEAVESNIGLAWLAWTADRLPVWQSVVAKNGEVDAQGNPATWETAPYNPNNPTGETLAEYYNSDLAGEAHAFIAAADGRATDSARSARANLITNYRFSEGRFKGFNIGGAVRWRSAPTIGYGVKTLDSGARGLDLDTAYKGDAEIYLDAILGYRGSMDAFGGFDYRVQLNVRNLLDEDDYIPVRALSTGEISKIAIVEPRLFILSFAVEL
ncbi:MAG: hypothetical protein ACREIA_18690 [Opitutaceae bacterium]